MSLRLPLDNRRQALMLRPKLILAFLAMSVVTALCGAIGLFYVSRIGSTVSVFTEVTSPMLVESMALVENARTMRSVFLRAITYDENIEGLSKQLADLHAQSQSHLQALHRLSAQADIGGWLQSANQYERDFVRALEKMGEDHRRERAVTVAVKHRMDIYNAQRSASSAMLLAIANRAEGKIVKTEDEAKVQVQTGTATVDGLGNLISETLNETYPLQQNATRLVREFEEIDDAVKLALAVTTPAEFDATEQKVRGIFKAIGSLSRKLGGRLRDDDGKTEFERIRVGLSELERSIFGPEGVFAGQRNVLTSRAEIAQGRELLDRIENGYQGILDAVKLAAGYLNQKARQEASEGISDARTVIAGSLVLAILGGLVFAIWFARRITEPTQKLTSHVLGIRESGEMVPLQDAAVTERRDELGMLSRSFNLMIAELADARHKLIEQSEAAINTQFQRLNAAINNMPQGLCMFDAEQRLIICNKRYAEIYQLDPENAKPGTPLRTILEDHVAKNACPEDVLGYVERRVARVAERRPFYHVNELRDGQVIAISHQPMANGGSVATHEDITERRKVEARIAYMAHHDALTDLPNRVSFREAMESALVDLARGSQLAVLCLDLDYFKAVNDTLGHPTGDALLKAVSQRIRECVRPNDTIARLGGDEFAILQLTENQPVDSTALSERLIRELAEPFEVGGHQVMIGVSIGIAIAPNDGSEPDQLMKNADMALYRAKADGRGRCRFFEPVMDEEMQRRRALEIDLRRAVARGEFEVYYQPTVDMRTHRLSGFEALLRWNHPKRGLVLPAEFIPLTEEIGLINQIGSWVLRQACHEAMKWPTEIRVAVNLSPVQFKGDAIVLEVISALNSSGLPPQRLELEITETILLKDTEATISTLNRLRALGVRIAMDDFGTGYSSLGYLRKFPFDKIKIDRSFIHDLADKPDSIAIVRAVAGLGSSLGISTTAEGVETEEQLRQLSAEGCTEVQGYLFSEAKPAHELGKLIKELRPASKAVA